MKRAVILVMAVMFIPACTTLQSPPTESAEDVALEVGEVIFDGTECTVTGSKKLPPGKYSYVLHDESEYEAQMYIGRLLDGKTTQDMLDLQGEPGAYVPEAVFDEAYEVVCVLVFALEGFVVFNFLEVFKAHLGVF